MTDTGAHWDGGLLGYTQLVAKHWSYCNPARSHQHNLLPFCQPKYLKFWVKFPWYWSWCKYISWGYGLVVNKATKWYQKQGKPCLLEDRPIMSLQLLIVTGPVIEGNILKYVIWLIYLSNVWKFIFIQPFSFEFTHCIRSSCLGGLCFSMKNKA